MKKMNSRQRMLRAMSLEEVDHTPCCFMSFTALRNRHAGDRYKVAEAQLEMGLDAMLFIPSAPRAVRPEHPDLRSAQGIHHARWHVIDQHTPVG